MTSGPRVFSEVVRQSQPGPIFIGVCLEWKRGKWRLRLSDEVWKKGKWFRRRKTWTIAPDWLLPHLRKVYAQKEAIP